MFRIFRVNNEEKSLVYCLFEQIYNAKTLAHIDGEYDEYTPLDGVVSSKHGSHPYVYLSSVVYKCSGCKGYIDNDGNPVAVHDESCLERVLIPDLNRSNFAMREVVPIEFNKPSKPVELPKPTISLEPPKPAVSPEPPKPAEPANSTELFSILCMRLYSIVQKQVNPPEDLVKDKIRITPEEFKKLDAEVGFSKIEMEPLLQLYEGSHRSPRRTFTCYGKNGKVYLVRTEFNPETGDISRA